MYNLINDLVCFKTVYPNYEEFYKCIEYIKDYFKGSRLHIKEYNFNNDVSLVISNTISKELDIIFCGHIDVVPADDKLFKIRKSADILYGRGVCDMKGQVAVLMTLMKELDTDKKIALFLTSDEERGGFNGTNRLLMKGYSCKVAVVPDGGSDFNLIIEEKGVLQLKITAVGTECHSSQPWVGQNPIIKLMELYNIIISKYPLPKNDTDWRTSVSLTKIEAGNAINKIPDSAAMYLDIRHINDDKKEDILSFLNGLSNDISIDTLDVGDVFYTDKDNYFIKKYIDICKTVLNHPIEVIKYSGASDARFFSAKSISCIMMNPIGGNFHGSDEWVNIKSLYILLDIYKEYIKSIKI